MEEEIKFENLSRLIDSFLDKFVEEYKNELIRTGKKASGNLINSIKKLEVEVDGYKIVGRISLADYWRWVEYGRGPGKFPPLNKILNWIEVKPVLPRPVNGITPSNRQLAYLIGRKIAREGIDPGNQMNTALNNVYNSFNEQIKEAINKDIDSRLTLILRDAGFISKK